MSPVQYYVIWSDPVLKAKQFTGSVLGPAGRLAWLFIFFTLLVGWGAVLAQIAAEYRDAENAAIARSQDRASSLHEHVVKTLQVAALTSLHLAESHFPAQPEKAESEGRIIDFKDPAIQIAGVAGVAIIDSRGNLIGRAGPTRLPDDWGLHPKTGMTGQIGGDLSISDPKTIEPSGEKYVFITRTVKGRTGPVGRVVLILKPEQFLNFPLRTKFDKTDLVSVINLNGITLARREGDKFSSGEDVRSRLVMRKQRESPNGSYLGPSSLDGLVRYFSHRRLRDYPLFVTAGVSQHATLTPVHRRAIGYVIVMGTMTAFALFLSWVVQRDAAYRRRRSVELAESARRLVDAQRIGKIGDWEYDLETGIITWSDQLCEMYERSPTDDELTLEEFSVYFSPESCGRIKKELKDLLTNGGEKSFEFKITLPSGAVSYRCINAVASLDDGGKVVGLYGTDQDMTSAHLVRELERQVAHLDRQGAMSMMAATLAHELNQPLTAASNYLTGSLRSLRRTDTKVASGIVSAIEGAQNQIYNAAEIIRRVRKMVQTDHDSSRSASVQDTASDAIALLVASGFHSAKTIQIDVDPSLPDAMIAPIQLQQVLLNLLKNALEAAPADTAVISLSAKQPEKDMLRIEVRDNGPGFSAETKDVFAGFQSEKESGLGLGLSISRTIAEYHGGKLFVEKSRPGETLLVVMLPSKGAEAA